jgi:hypothetical protein
MTKPNRARLSKDSDSTIPRPRRCPACSRLNPAEAYYCHHDGAPLLKDLQQLPSNVGSVPFPTPFCFADGRACINFNQLALGCNNHWEEAGALLTDGIWPSFFAAIGRLDLAAAAKQAAQEPDHDRGLSQLLEKLPADAEFLQLPKLALGVTEVNLGFLKPGTNLVFELPIQNQGMLLLHGVASTSCDWLAFGNQVGPLTEATGPTWVLGADRLEPGDHAGTAQKVFRTRLGCALPVLVLGNRLRAGLKPLRGEIVVETNGGAVTLPVRVEIPIRAFPKGNLPNNVLAGVTSPRDLALRAKENPKAAGVLFEGGAVQAWYESNGWTYPIEGSVGSGVGAVQQFFEALGLTQPPRLEIDMSSLSLKGKIGECLSTALTIRTKDAKPVYAHAWSNRDWVRLQPIKFLGARAKIPVEIMVPSNPGETVQAQVTIQGNGKQRFVIPVTVVVRGG